ncbi:MAG: hypothetical protein U0270_33150 [Labilithrix sp.]
MRSSVSGTSTRIATVIVLVWTRPRLSFGATRCQRWPPASSTKSAAADAPVMRSAA